MEIEKQSKQCKKNNETSTEPMSYDGNPCASHDERVESTAKNGDVKSKKNQVAYLDPDVEIHGFLKFFLFVIFIGGLFTAVASIMTYNVEKNVSGYLFALGYVIWGILFFFLACYTIFSFLTRKPNAVFLGKTLACVQFATQLMNLVFGGAVGNPFAIIVSLVYPLAFFLYVAFSEQVQDIIPKSYRKPFKFDYFLIAALIIAPVLFFVFGGIKDVSSKLEEQEQEFIEAANLKEGEYTDGRIIFAVPEGFTCEEIETGDPEMPVFNLEFDNINMQIVSCYDTYMQTVIDSDNKSMKYFDEWWDAWQDEDLEDIPYVELRKKKMKANGNPFYWKSVRYEMEQPIVWHFGLIIHVPTSKLCVISSMQIEDESINDFVELIETIRF